MRKDEHAAPKASEAETVLSPRPLSAAAQRALAEAAERRSRADGEPKKALEIGGRDGPDPVRYGDWEVKGIASDF